MVIPSYMVSCTSFVPANAPEQAVFCDHLKSNINELISCRNFKQHDPMFHNLLLKPNSLCLIILL